MRHRLAGSRRARGAGDRWVTDLRPYLRPHGRWLVTALVLAVVGQGVLGLLPLLQSEILNQAILTHHRALSPLLVALMGLGAASYLTQYARRYLSARVSLDVQHDMAVALHDHVMALDPTRLDEVSGGDVLSRATGDLTLVQMFLNQVPLLTAHLTLLIVAVVAMFVLSPMLAVVVAVWIPLFLFVAARYRQRVFPASWHDQRAAGRVAEVVEEAVNGVRVVKAFGQEGRLLDTVTTRAAELFGSRMRTARLTARSSATLQAIPYLAQLAVLALGGWLALQHHLSIGVFLAFCTYLLQIVAPVRLLSGMMTTSQQARAGMQRVQEIMTIEPSREPAEATDLEVRAGLIEVDDVTFAYRDGPPAITHLSLRIEPGERVAIVGASGAGKSTFALLMGRFLEPGTGAVRIDGQDLGQVRRASVHRNVGVVFEEAFLFAASIRDNIAAGRPDATAGEVERAARAAQAHDFIGQLPKGYDTVVGERGYTLSGGQRQRIALARTILADPAVLILDDATSAVDPRTERAMFAAFDQVLGQRTTVMVAHRPSTLQLATRIVIMDEGGIAAEGTHDQLLAVSPRYRELLAGPTERAKPTGAHGRPSATDPAAWPDRHGSGHDLDGGPDRRAAACSAAGSTGSAGASLLGVGQAGLTVATPELLARVAALPAAPDRPDTDVDGLRDPAARPTLATLVDPLRRAMLGGLGLLLIDAATSLSVPLLIRFALDSGVAGHRSSVVFEAAALFAALQLISWVNAGAMYRQIARTAERVLYRLRIATFAHLQRLSLAYYDRQMSGGIMTRMTSDMDAVAQLLQQGLITALSSILTSIGVLAVLAVIDWHLVVPASSMVAALLVGTWAYWHWSAPAYLQARDRSSVVNASLSETLLGLRDVQALSLQAQRRAVFDAAATAFQASKLRAQHVLALYFPLPQALACGAKVITLAAGAQLFVHGHLVAGTLVAVLLYFDLFFNPMQQLSTVFDQWLQARVAIRRVDELLATPTTTPAATDPRDPGRLVGEVGFEGVRFSYSDDHPEVLRGIDLRIPAGDTLALVGTTGAGKSTFVKLVARFYDVTAGRITVDGQELSGLDLPAYRRQLGYVPQESLLFSGDVRANIAFGRPDASDLEVETAARAVGAHRMISRLPAGYRTALVRGGHALSAGERQLVCLARAQLVDPVILILDEATSNLDLATEATVRSAMEAISKDRTTLLIAHRLQTARTADRIVVVEEGRIAESGTHEELLDQRGRYAELWDALSRGGDRAGRS